MPYYAQINEAHVVVAVTETSGVIDAPHMILITSADIGLLGSSYSVQTGLFTAPEPVPLPRHLAPASFKRRLTQPERIGIREAAKVSAEVYDFMDLLDTSKFIDLDDPLTQYGLQQLEAGGLLAAGRAAEILTAPVQESERP